MPTPFDAAPGVQFPARRRPDMLTKDVRIFATVCAALRRRETISIGRSLDVHVKCHLNKPNDCAGKRFYNGALAAGIDQFIGVSDLSEPLVDHDVVVATDGGTPEAGVRKILLSREQQRHLGAEAGP